MGGRLRLVFERLCREGKAETVDSLGKSFGVSTRSVYNDIDRLNSLLVQHGCEPISNDRGILTHPGAIPIGFDDLVGEEILYLDSELRRLRIVQEVLTINEPFSVKQLQARIPLSRNTLSRELGEVKAALSKRGIELFSKPYSGYRVVGDEGAIRLSLATALYEDELFFDAAADNTVQAAEQDFERLIHRIEALMGVSYSDESVDYLVCVLVACWMRIRGGHSITHDDCLSPAGSLGETREMKAMVQLASEYSTLGGAESREELAFVAERLGEARVIRTDDALSENWMQMNLVVNSLIEAVGRECGVADFTNDEMLFSGLLNHLQPAYRRALRSEVVANPLLDYIHTDCSELLAAVKKSIVPIEELLGVSFPEEELGFFTLFFAASLERLRKSLRRAPTAIVVCREGVATSQLLRAQLDSEFDVLVVGEFGAREARSWLADNDVDLVISTTSIDLPGREVVEVSPWLSEKDREQLMLWLAQRSRPVEVDRLVGIVGQHVSLDDQTARDLRFDFARYLGIQQQELNGKELYRPMLREVMTKDLIELGFHATDRESAVREAGRLLVEGGVAEPEYVDAMVENVEVNGTYIVIAPGIAMPHARPDRGSKGIGFSLVTLSEPVAFGHPSNDPVRLVVALCAVDHQSHLDALAELAEILGSEESVRAIEEAKCVEEVLELIGPKKGAIDD